MRLCMEHDLCGVCVEMIFITLLLYVHQMVDESGGVCDIVHHHVLCVLMCSCVDVILCMLCVL